MATLFLLLAVALAVFIFIHFRPLDDDEIRELALKRRKKATTTYYAHDPVQYRANSDAKKSMPSFGGLFPVEWELNVAPPIVASLLKFKKHEWIVVGFESQRLVRLLWMNKGSDKLSVGLGLAIDRIRDICQESGYRSVLVFHNHIHPRQTSYNTGIPSGRDLESSNEWAQNLATVDVTLVGYICERGVPYRFFLNVPDSQFPLAEFQSAISLHNAHSWLQNLSLHMERIF